MRPRSFKSRYLFAGRLALKTGLHIGSGWTAGSPSNDPVIRTPDGQPFIPGSSFKGAFRSTVEKLAPNVGLRTCLLDHGDPEVKCLSPQNSRLGEAFRTLRNYENQSIRSDDQEGVETLEALGHPEWQGRRITEDDLMSLLGEHLCDTCKLFGSPFAASRVLFSDLLPPEGDTTADRMIQIRDGVAIDRDSEKAVDGFKYDYEVVAPAQTFHLEILLEDPTSHDLALTCLGLSEFVGGLGYIGGNRSRGLGNCQVDDLAIYELDLTVADATERANRLKTYLLGKTPQEKMTGIADPSAFLDEHVLSLPAFQEVSNA